MKRLKQAMVLCICMAVCWSCAAGEGAIPFQRGEEPSGTGFVFRGGITWGMAPEQVQAAENTEMIERSQDEWSVLYSRQKVSVSRFTADLVFMFHRAGLKMITYDFGPDAGAGSYGYLTGALSSVYGDSDLPEGTEIVRVMDRIYPGYYTPDRLKEIRGWTAADGTRVYLYYYGESAYAILYVSPDTAGAGDGVYVTDGL